MKYVRKFLNRRELADTERISDRFNWFMLKDIGTTPPVGFVEVTTGYRKNTYTQLSEITDDVLANIDIDVVYFKAGTNYYRKYPQQLFWKVVSYKKDDGTFITRGNDNVADIMFKIRYLNGWGGSSDGSRTAGEDKGVVGFYLPMSMLEEGDFIIQDYNDDFLVPVMKGEYVWTEIQSSEVPSGYTFTDGQDTCSSINDVTPAVQHDFLYMKDTTNNKYYIKELAPPPPDYYGVSWTFDNEGNSTVTRVGNIQNHRELPIQSKMKGCLLNPNGTVNYYLDPNDWSKKDDGVTSSVLTGADGDVMVEVPQFYYSYSETGSGADKVSQLLISETQLNDEHTWIQSPKHYIGAYKGHVDANNKLCSIAGTYASNDFSLISFHNYARNKHTGDNWNLATYWMRKSLWMLFVTEYGTLNSQADFNAQLTHEGYHQGGLGIGITQGNANNTIGGYAQTITGYTNVWNNTPIGNFSVGGIGSTPGSGSLEAGDMYDSASPVTVNKKCRYRGIENPFGEVYEWLDGVFVKNYVAYEIIDKANYGKISGGSYDYNGDKSTDCRTIGNVSQTNESLIKTILGGTYCDLFPSATNTGDVNNYYRDGWWIANGYLGILYGGFSNSGYKSGLMLINAGPSNVIIQNPHTVAIGTRLAYIL